MFRREPLFVERFHLFQPRRELDAEQVRCELKVIDLLDGSANPFFDGIEEIATDPACSRFAFNTVA